METTYEDKSLRCKWDVEGEPCNQPFTWSAKDQEFYAKQNFAAPKYCRPHREERKRRNQGPFAEALKQARATEEAQ